MPQDAGRVDGVTSPTPFPDTGRERRPTAKRAGRRQLKVHFTCTFTAPEAPMSHPRLLSLLTLALLTACGPKGESAPAADAGPASPP